MGSISLFTLDPSRFGAFYWIGLGGVIIFIFTTVFYRLLKGSVLRRRIINELMNEVNDEATLERNANFSMQEARANDL